MLLRDFKPQSLQGPDAANVARSARTPSVAALVVDVDRFKFFNVALQSAHGDLLLKAVAERLREFVKQGDTLARLSRDEFVLLLTNLTSGNEAAMVATMIIESFTRLIVVEERELFVTVSIGISLFPEDGDGDEMRATQTSRCIAPKTGGGCFEFYDEEVSKRAQDQVEMASAALRAERQELELHYQPCVDLNPAIRGGGPDAGRSRAQNDPPALFVPLAEEQDSSPIGEWSAERQSQAKAWQGIGSHNVRGCGQMLSSSIQPPKS
jgi:diguanylate cyclase (GGDEF)-like protein